MRVRFTKVGKVRFTSHRDLARIWERALRRAEVPVAYSGGFSPRPRLHFGLALATGAESDAEYLDVDVEGDLDLPGAGGSPGGAGTLAARLSEALPVGVDVTAVAEVAPGGPSLQEAISSCEWSFSFPGLDPDVVRGAAERALAASTLPVERERKGRSVTDDLRPQLHALQIVRDHRAGQPCTPTPAGTTAATLLAELGTQPRTVRPAELVAVLDPESSWPEPRVRRLSQWIAHEGGRREPLDAPPPSWARTDEVCAS
jgi:radical SAM-linked protein